MKSLNFGGTPYNESLEFYILKDMLPSDLMVEVSGTYQSANGTAKDIRAVAGSFYLPLGFTCQVLQP